MVAEVKAMELKKSQQPTTGVPKDAAAQSKKVQAQSFISDIKAELKKISWTSPEELRTYTKIVVGTTFFFGMGIYCVDLLIQSALRVLDFSIRMMVG